MDPPCIELCKAINSVAGLKTRSSCCGHNRRPMSIEIEWQSELDLMVICRALDIRYYRQRPESCTLRDGFWIPKDKRRRFIFHAEETDMLEMPIVWCLESIEVGRKAYRHAAQLAKDIRDAKKSILKWRAKHA
jgi:hypothetical protein